MKLLPALTLSFLFSFSLYAQVHYERYFDNGGIESGASVVHFGEEIIGISGFTMGLAGSRNSGTTLIYDENNDNASFQLLNTSLRSDFPLLSPIDEGAAYLGGSLARIGNTDSWIVYRMNENGTIDPVFEAGRFSVDQIIREVFTTQDGGVVVTGGSSTIRSGMMALYDRNGDQVWDLGVERDNSRILLGDMNQIGQDYFVSGSVTSSLPNWLPLIVKASPTGTPLWMNEYRLPNGTFTNGGISPIAVTDDGNFVIAYQLVQNGATEEILLMKIDPEGTVLWSKRVETTGQLRLGRSLQKLDNDGFLIVGTHIDGANASTGFLFEFSSEGDIRWSRTYGPDRETSLIRTAPRADGDGILAIGHGTPCNQATRDVYLLSLDRQGEGLPPSCGVQDITLTTTDIQITPVATGRGFDYQSGTNTLPTFRPAEVATVISINCSSLDLDEDDSSGATGNDFSQEVQCVTTSLSIADQDIVYVGDGHGIDSIVVDLISSVAMDSLTHTSTSGINVTSSGSDNLTFINLDGLDAQAMATLFNDIAFTPVDISGNRSVLITMYTPCGERVLAQSFFNLTESMDASLDLGQDLIICPGDSVELDATVTTGVIYNWSGGQNTPSIFVSNSGTFSVTVTDDCNLQLIDTITISQDLAGNLSIEDSNTELVVCEGDSLVLDATTFDADSYLWANGSIDPQRTVSAAGAYEVLVYNACDSATLTYTLSSSNCCAVYLPNAFSPNQDGVNDSFKALPAVAGCENLGPVILNVYDRWGGEVFVGNGLTGWNGNGRTEKPISPGTYAYILSYSIGAVAVEKTGMVNLIR